MEKGIFDVAKIFHSGNSIKWIAKILTLKWLLAGARTVWRVYTPSFIPRIFSHIKPINLDILRNKIYDVSFLCSDKLNNLIKAANLELPKWISFCFDRNRKSRCQYHRTEPFWFHTKSMPHHINRIEKKHISICETWEIGISRVLTILIMTTKNLSVQNVCAW